MILYLFYLYLYKNICDDNDTFEIDDKYYSSEIIINNNDDLIKYIQIIDFWSCDTIPHDIYKYVFDNKKSINMELLNQFDNKFDLINDIKIIITDINYVNLCFINNIINNNGSIDLLKYAHENGYTSNKETCEIAAKNGNLEILKYARENGCTWDKETCEYAALYGKLDCLKYAHENGCPFSKKSLDFSEKVVSGKTTFFLGPWDKKHVNVLLKMVILKF